MDDAVIHKVDGIREMVEERGSRLIYLPQYSPDLNPVEEAFSSIDAWLRTNRDRVQAQIEGDDDVDADGVIWEAIDSITSDDAHGWYQHCSYIA